MREDQILHVLPRGVRGLLTGKRLKYEYLQEISGDGGGYAGDAGIYQQLLSLCL